MFVRHLLGLRGRRGQPPPGVGQEPLHVAVGRRPSRKQRRITRRLRGDVRDDIRLVQHVNRMSVIVEQAECQPAGLRRRRERRTGGRDARDARHERRDPDDRPAVNGHPIDVADPVRLGDERDHLAVGRDLRRKMLAAQERLNRMDVARRQIEARQPKGSGLQRVEIRAEPLGDEDDRTAVWREHRLEIGERIVRQAIHLARAEPHAIEIDQPAPVAADHDGLAVGRERRIDGIVETGKRDLAIDVTRFGIDEGDDRRPPRTAVIARSLAIRTPRARRVQELRGCRNADRSPTARASS